jgi:AraC-like DNA-binding protein
MEPLRLLTGAHAKTLHPGTALSGDQQKHTRLYLNKWESAGVHAVRYPYLAAVIEGEIDWRIGITQSTLTHPDYNIAECDYLIIPVQQGNFFFMPPGTAYSDGTNFHWDRSAPKKKQAIIFSMLILPTGFMCHFCRSTATEHICHPQIFLSSPQVHTLARMLEDQLLHGNCEDAIIRGLLQAILGYAEHALEEEIIVQPNKNNSSLFGNSLENQDIAKDALQRAKNHIEMNLKEVLNPDSIARHSYISARQLDRYFLSELGVNTMRYVTDRRMQTAKGLLQDTDLSVKQIGMLVGYNNPSSFVQVFKRHVGQSPGNFREE